MRLGADDYRHAALERIEAARRLHAQGLYCESIYLSGVATECILRAYRVRRDPSFDTRHDLVELLRASNLERLVPRKRRAQLAAALGDIWARWKNDYRYASSARLSSALRKRGLFEGVRGDQLKANSAAALESSLEIVSVGEARWKTTFCKD